MKGGNNVKEFKKLALLMIVLVALLFTCYLSTIHNKYVGNSYFKNIFYAEGDGNPDNPPPQNAPGNLG